MEATHETPQPVVDTAVRQLPEWLTVAEYARLMRISLSAAYRAAHRGDVPIRKVGRIVRIPRSAVQAAQ